MAHRVLVTDKLADEGLALLRAEPGIEVVVEPSSPRTRRLCAALHEADGIVIRSGTQLTAEVLDDQTRLKAIVRAGVGVDNIDVPAATRQGIVVMNTPGGNTVSTAEHTMALMLALARNVRQGQRQPEGGQVGPQQVHRHPARRQDAGHRRPGAGRPGGRQAAPRGST